MKQYFKLFAYVLATLTVFVLVITGLQWLLQNNHTVLGSAGIVVGISALIAGFIKAVVH